jgi:hypothetical protein
MKRLLVGACFLSLSAAVVSAQLATQATPNPSPGGTKARPQRPLTYGTKNVSYIEVPANAFFPGNSSAAWTSLDFGRGQRYGTSASLDFVAPLRLPAGAQVVYLELDGNDNNATAAVYGSLTVCNFEMTGCTYHPVTGSSIGNDCTVSGFICSGVAATPGNGELINNTVDITADGIFVDNFFNTYSLLAETNGATDGSVAIGGMIVGYILQVSPAPPTATFNDVPTTDGAFQFIEAFNAAGITSGCSVSPPLYCPDANVTRRQMAVFFAKALGLQFP